MRDIDLVFDALAKSTFRRRFRLGAAEQAYLERKGLAAVLQHGRDFVDKRLAPAQTANDGKQTPFRGAYCSGVKPEALTAGAQRSESAF
jgi:Domain of unknown function (DUF4186)